MASKIKELIVILGISTICLAGCTSNINMPDTVKVESTENNDVVSVNASSEVTVVPDKAVISIGTESRNKIAEKAQDEHTEKVNRIIELFKGLGIEESDIQTTNYNMYSDYEYNNGSRDFIGYVVSCTIEIKNIEIENIGEYITKSINAGATEVNRIRYECTKYDEVYESALKDAIAQATHKATVMAETSGRKLGKVTYINEGYQNTSYRYVDDYSTYDGMLMNSAKATSEESFIDIMPGEISIEAEINMSFELED